MRTTLYDLLKRSLCLTQDYELGEHEVPFEAALIDWKNAAKVPCDEIEGNPYWLWRTFVQKVGYRHELVLDLTDPAIRPLVKKLMEAGFLVMDSCSGHPDNPQPYINMVLPKHTMAMEKEPLFATKVRQACQELGISCFTRGAMVGMLGTFGPLLTYQETTYNFLPVYISLKAGDETTLEDVQKFWQAIALAAELPPPGQGLINIEDLSLSSGAPTFDVEEIIRQVYTDEILS